MTAVIVGLLPTEEISAKESKIVPGKLGDTHTDERDRVVSIHFYNRA